MNTSAILVIGHFVVSIFGFQLGQPVFQYVPFPNMGICAQYAEGMQGDFNIDSEYKLLVRTQCVTQEEYDAWIEQNTPSE